MNRYTKIIPWVAVLALTAMSAVAQNTTPPNTTAAPAAVGVSPQTAAEANQKAVPRSDTGTVVRTSPSPADKASAALNDVPPGTANNRAGTTSMDSPSGNRPVTGMRRARADRN